HAAALGRAGDRGIDGRVVRGRDHEALGGKQPLVPVLREMPYPPGVRERPEPGREPGRGHRDAGAGTREQGRLALGDRAAAHHEARLALELEEYGEMLHERTVAFRARAEKEKKAVRP